MIEKTPDNIYHHKTTSLQNVTTLLYKGRYIFILLSNHKYLQISKLAY